MDITLDSWVNYKIEVAWIKLLFRILTSFCSTFKDIIYYLYIPFLELKVKILIWIGVDQF